MVVTSSMSVEQPRLHFVVSKIMFNDEEPPEPPLVGELWDAWEANLKALCPQVLACQGAYELVEATSKLNIPLAIATCSRYTPVAKKRIRHEEMFQKIIEIVAGDATDIYLEAARRLGVNPTECLVFEDAMSGVQSGKAAGCVVVAVPDPRMDKTIFEGVADVVLDNLSQFDGRPWGLKI